MENRIKEQQLGLFADRTSCQGWWANQLRLLFSSAAYVLLEAIRRLGLAGTELARAQVGTMVWEIATGGLVRSLDMGSSVSSLAYGSHESTCTYPGNLKQRRLGLC